MTSLRQQEAVEQSGEGETDAPRAGPHWHSFAKEIPGERHSGGISQEKPLADGTVPF